MIFSKMNVDPFKIFLSAASGLLLTIAFPTTDFYFLAYIAFVPFFYALNNNSGKQNAIYGLIFGFFHFSTQLSWVVYTINTYGFLPIWLCIPILFLLVFYLSLYTTAFSWLVTRFSKDIRILFLLTPPLWTSLEYIRAKAFTGFPWELLGYSQYKFLSIIQVSDIAGVYGISFLIMTVNVTLFMLLLFFQKKDWFSSTIQRSLLVISVSFTLIFFISVFSYGFFKIKTIDKLVDKSEKKSISVIQGNIDQSLKWKDIYQKKTIDKYNRLSYMALENKPELIVWPETAAPFYYLYNKEMTNRIFDGIRSTKAAHIIGSPCFEYRDDDFIFFNSAYLTTPEAKTIDKYDKVHLVPFGEYVPLKNLLFFVSKLTEQSGNFVSGETGKLLDYNNSRYGVQICFEIVFPELSRASTLKGADILINMTNDAWFGKKSAPFQHFSMVIFRAVENKRSLARSANTGISGFIDPVGRVISKTSLFEDAHLTAKLPILKVKTFYTRYGDIFAWLSMILTCLIIIDKKYALNKIFTSSK